MSEGDILVARGRQGIPASRLARLWRAPMQLQGGAPLWIGSTQTLRYTQPFGVFGQGERSA